MSQQLTNWSFSKLLNYEACPMRVKLRYIDRIPEPERPADNPLERGNREHKRCEQFIKGEAVSGWETKRIDDFMPMLEHLQMLYSVNLATAEDDWLFDADWNPCSKSGHWLWAKLDYLAHDPENEVVVIGDFKTGKSQYKAIEHVQQTQIYAAISALKYEDAQTFTTEIAYLDEGHIKSFTYNRDQALSFVGRFQHRVDRMLADRFFRPNPNKVTCRWCPYGPANGNGACPVGV